MKEIYLAEKKALVKRWEKTGLLKGLSGYVAEETALMIENQRLVNEQFNDTGDIAQFKRISIPLVRRIIPNLAAFKLASVQGMLGPNSKVSYYKKNKLEETDLISTIKKLKAVWSYEAQQDLRKQHCLDAEAELTAILAQEITLELDRMILTDLRNGAALKKEIDFDHLPGELPNEKFALVQEHIYDLATESQDLYGRPFANWIVTSPEMAKAICVDDKGWNFSIGIEECGELATDKGNIKIYRDPLFPVGQILMGYKGEVEYDAGYVFAPYVMLQQTPVILDPDTFSPRRGLLCKYGKIMTDSTYYSLLTIKNFKTEEKKQVQQMLDATAQNCYPRC